MSYAAQLVFLKLKAVRAKISKIRKWIKIWCRKHGGTKVNKNKNWEFGYKLQHWGFHAFPQIILKVVIAKETVNKQGQTDVPRLTTRVMLLRDLEGLEGVCTCLLERQLKVL